MYLNELKTNEYAKVLQVLGEGATRHHLLDMGVIPGAIVKIDKFAPLGDPIEILVYGYNLTIRLADAKNIEVEKLTDDFKFFTECANCKNCKKCNIYTKKATSENCKKYKDCNKCSSNINTKICKKSKTNNKVIITHPGLGETGKFHDKKNENPLPQNTMLSFALIGNQNTGKTTLFNYLTGSNQHIGNFPGVTVDKKSGTLIGKKNTLVIDLPGIYSLSPYSTEEKVSRDFILNERPNCIIDIIDANNIERNLNLTLQLLELDIPVVLAINMMDEFTANGGSIDINALETKLGIPIVPISAMTGAGVSELIDHAIHIARYQEKPKINDFCGKDDHGGAVHRAIHSIMHLIEDHAETKKLPKRFVATKIIEGDTGLYDILDLAENEIEMIAHILIQLESERGLDRVAAIADMRFSFIRKVCDEVVLRPDVNKGLEASNKIDRFLTGKYTGIPAFIIIMGIIFFLTFNVIGSFFQNILASGIDNLSNVVRLSLSNVGVNATIISLIIDGIFNGVGSVLSFIPIILTLFLFLSLLEDSGYMARVAFVMDKLLRKLGLSGRSIVPLIIGFGCTVPAVMSTRTIPSNRDRKLTILILPFMTCSAKLPIYGFFANTFFPKHAGFIMIGLYVFSMIIGIIYALIIKSVGIKGKPVPFIMELPSYRMPSPINVIKLLWEKAKDFLQKAFTIIFVATIVIWFLQNFDLTLHLVSDQSTSILSILAGHIAVIFAPIGLADYKIITSLISGFLAKESVVSTLNVLYGSSATLLSIFSYAQIVSLLIFSCLYTPCIASIAAIKQELGTRWAMYVLVMQCVLAYLISFIAYNIINFLI